MRRVYAIIGSAVFLVVAPGVVAGYIPWTISHWRFAPSFFGFPWLRIVGCLFIAAGLPVLLDSFGRFALEGLGTPNPVMPTRHLVVTGFYRFVRNPMYIAVDSVIVGQGLLFANRRVVGYAAVVAAAFFFFVLLYEEPTMRRSFGSDYDEYRSNVPRWLPRLTPWQAPK